MSAEEAIREVQKGQERPLVPGWEQLCNVCVYKDFYQTFKNSSSFMQELQKQNLLVRNLTRQLNVTTKEVEILRDKYESVEEEDEEKEEESKKKKPSE